MLASFWASKYDNLFCSYNIITAIISVNFGSAKYIYIYDKKKTKKMKKQVVQENRLLPMVVLTWNIVYDVKDIFGAF
jgi:hypothetical protein